MNDIDEKRKAESRDRFVQAYTNNAFPRSTYELTDEDIAKISEWLKTEVYPEFVEHQRGYVTNPSEPLLAEALWAENIPYLPPIGGGLSITFTATTVLMCVRVTFEAGGKKWTKDFTDWDNF